MNNLTKYRISVLSDYSDFESNLYKIIPVLPVSGVGFRFFNSVYEIEELIKNDKPNLIILNKVRYVPEEINYLINIDYKNISILVMIDSYFKYDLFYKNYDKGLITIRRPISINKFLEVLKSSLFSTLKKNKSSKDYLNYRAIEMAKTFLITYENMFEDESHKYLEKCAMDERISTYEKSLSIVSKYLYEKEDIKYECKG